MLVFYIILTRPFHPHSGRKKTSCIGNTCISLHDRLASGGLSADNIVDGMLLRDVGVRRGHGRHDLLARALAIDLPRPAGAALEGTCCTVVPPALARTPT
jgi:hypothetical protein